MLDHLFSAQGMLALSALLELLSALQTVPLPSEKPCNALTRSCPLPFTLTLTANLCAHICERFGNKT